MSKSIKIWLAVTAFLCLVIGGYYFLDKISLRDILMPDVEINNEGEENPESVEPILPVSDGDSADDDEENKENVESEKDFSEIEKWKDASLKIKSELTPAQIAEWQEKLAQAQEGLKTDSSCQENPRDCYSFYEQIGLAKQMLGDLADAVNAYEQAIGNDPTNYFSYISLGDIYQSIEDYYKAEEYYISAITARSEENIGYLKLGELYYDDKIPDKKDQCEQIWRQGMFKSNNYYSLMLRLADYFYETRKLEEAEGFYQAYLNYDPDNERVREMLFKVNREKGTEK